MSSVLSCAHSRPALHFGSLEQVSLFSLSCASARIFEQAELTLLPAQSCWMQRESWNQRKMCLAEKIANCSSSKKIERVKSGFFYVCFNLSAREKSWSKQPFLFHVDIWHFGLVRLVSQTMVFSCMVALVFFGIRVLSNLYISTIAQLDMFKYGKKWSRFLGSVVYAFFRKINQSLNACEQKTFVHISILSRSLLENFPWGLNF